MSSLLLIEEKLCKNSIELICKKKNCEVVILDKNLLKELKKKCGISKIILLTENILSRNVKIYTMIKEFLKNKDIFFIEIGFKKSKISNDKAFSNALINGSGINTETILEKIINLKL